LPRKPYLLFKTYIEEIEETYMEENTT